MKRINLDLETDQDGVRPNTASKKIKSQPGTPLSAARIILQSPSVLETTEKWPMVSYSLTKRRNKGMCLIINNEDYSKTRHLQNRLGSRKDADSLKKFFSGLGIYVDTQTNLTKDRLDTILDKVRSYKALETYNFFIVVLLSHGNDDHVTCVDGENKMIKEIMDCFKGDCCPPLKGIPKWLIIQTSRGSFNRSSRSAMGSKPQWNGTRWVNEMEHDTDGNLLCHTHKQSPENTRKIPIPACSDFFVSHNFSDDPSSAEEGSWFVQSLVGVLDKFHRSEDVSTMMTRVNGSAAVAGHDFYRHMPYHVNMLTSVLYLHEQEGEKELLPSVMGC